MKLNINFKDIIKEYIINNNLFNTTSKSIYTLNEILNVVEYILITGASWRSLNLSIFKNTIKWQSIYYHFNKWINLNIFKKIYMQLLTRYFKQNFSGKLKFLSVDSSFIKNEYATKNTVGFNGHYKKKRLSKLSLIVDVNGVPLSALLTTGKTSDSVILLKNFSDMYIDIKYKKENNKHKRYILADAAYDTYEIKDKIKEFNIIPIIDYNKRNTKNKSIMKMNEITKAEKNIYKNRIIIENCFSWLFKNRRISRRYDKHISTYYAFLLISFIKIIIKRI